MGGAVGLARLARKLDVSEIDVTQAFTRLGETLGIDWVQSTAARMVPSDPWERPLVSGVARDLQKIRLDFLSETTGKEIDTHAARWLAAEEQRVEHMRQHVTPRRSDTATH